MGEMEDQHFQVTARNGADRVAQYQDLNGYNSPVCVG